MLRVFLTSLALTVGFMALTGLRRNTDYRHDYKPIAQRLIQGKGLTTRNGDPAVRYPPGYPLLLAGIYRAAHVVGVDAERARAAIAALSMAISSVLIYLIAKPVWGSGKAQVAAAVWTTYPLALWNACQPGSEMTFTLLAFAAFAWFWGGVARGRPSYGNCFLAGVLAGLAMLVRPIGIGLGILMAGLLILLDRRATWRHRVLLGGTLLIANALTVMPWQLWAYSQTGRFIVLSTGGPPSMRDGLTFAANPKTYREAIVVPEAARRVMRRIYDEYPSLTSFRTIASTLVHEFRRDPVAVVTLFGVKAARSIYGTDSGGREGLVLLVQLPYLLAVVLAAVAAWKRGGKARNLAICVCTLLVYFWAMTICALSIARYMVPALGLSFVLLPALVPSVLGKRGTHASNSVEMIPQP